MGAGEVQGSKHPDALLPTALILEERALRRALAHEGAEQVTTFARLARAVEQLGHLTLVCIHFHARPRQCPLPKARAHRVVQHLPRPRMACSVA